MDLQLTEQQTLWCEEALRRLELKKESDARNDYRALTAEAAATAAATQVSVHPYAATRWIVAEGVDANFIPALGPTVICSAQPDVSHFWDMVLHFDCRAIVKLTENDTEEYFPVRIGESRNYSNGRIRVTNRALSCSSHDVFTRVLDVQSSDKSLSVRLLQYPWSDFGVPRTMEPIQEMLEQLCSLDSGSYIVHCKAGIGRSGTFVTIDHILRRILLAGDVAGACDAAGVVRELRQYRIGVVETEEQYWFCFRAVIAELRRLLELARKRELEVSNVEYAVRLDDIL